MAINYPITLSTTEPNNDVGLIKIRQADEQTQTLIVQITENGVPRSYEGLQPFFCAKLGQSAGLGIIEQKLNTSELTNPKTGQLEYTMRKEDWQTLGRQVGYFSFRKMKDDYEFIEQFSTKDFYFNVTRNIFSGGVTEVKKDGSTYVWTIEDLKRLYQEYIASGKTDWEEFVEQNKEIIESVDPGGQIFTALGTLVSFREWDKDIISKMKNEFAERGINVKTLGATGDGVTDDWQIIQDALNTYKYVILPSGNYAISKPLNLRQGQALVGVSETVRDYGQTATIKYISAEDSHKSVILLGKNEVDAEPINDGTNNALINVLVDANNLAGFGIYGTYLTNETIIDNVTIRNSLEYNMYLAKSWYATIRNITSLDCKNHGLSFGMPIYYLDGSVINWTSANALEMNQCKIDNIRSARAGSHFWQDNPSTFKLKDHLYLGFGIGAGMGHAFEMKSFLSESSGGVNLFDWNQSNKVKSLSNGYLERSCYNSGLDTATEVANLVIENTTNAGGISLLKDIFMNYNSGGIYHKGNTQYKHHLENVYEPRFLKSLDGLSQWDLYGVVLKKNVHHECGQYNTDPGSMSIDTLTTVNSRYSFTIDPGVPGMHKVVYVKRAGDVQPAGTVQLNYDDGTYTSRSYPTNLGTEFVQLTLTESNLKSITRAGAAGTVDANVTFKIINLAPTYY
ncbi:BppU family phage baseplate upper protein [Enterococcus songbeiensis]